MCIHKDQEHNREVIKKYLEADSRGRIGNYISKSDLEVALAYYFNEPVKVVGVDIDCWSHEFKGLRLQEEKEV